jgi:enoyl-CoA hydratase/carnithine racemase
MAYDNLKLDVGEDFVAALTLNRPDQLNTFNTPLAEELDAALIELDADDRVRVVLLKGAGKAFCAGIDVKELAGKTAMEYRSWIETMERPLLRIAQMVKPVIAQLHGVAAANGAGLAVAADLTIAGQGARLGLTAINVGLNCVGPVVPVSKALGRKRALEMLLYGELLSAEQALSFGLVNRIVPDDRLEAEARSWAAALAAKSPVAVQIAKQAYYAAENMDYDRAFAFMNEAFARLCTTEDAKEGVSAFFEKRAPQWKLK